MALDLHIAGPGLDVHRRLRAGEPPLVLGRDSECAVCLPDPERNVSRRHLSVWNDGERLHFQVLSEVNGVDLPGGALPPGAAGILRAGEVMAVAAYRLAVRPILGDADPWTEFEEQVADMVPDGTGTLPPVDGEDPFDWGFHSTFGHGSPGGGLQAEDRLPATDLLPFFRGLGVREPLSMSRAEMEAVGRLMRMAVEGLLQAAAQAEALARPEGVAEDPSQSGTRQIDPLRRDAPLQAKLDYLFCGATAGAGLPPERALAQLVTELGAHQEAAAEALQEAARAVVREFEPEGLKKRLLGGGTRIFESARAWDAFVRDFAERQSGGDEWLRLLLDRHFARAYARALLRAKRNTTERKEG